MELLYRNGVDLLRRDSLPSRFISIELIYKTFICSAINRQTFHFIQFVRNSEHLNYFVEKDKEQLVTLEASFTKDCSSSASCCTFLTTGIILFGITSSAL